MNGQRCTLLPLISSCLRSKSNINTLLLACAKKTPLWKFTTHGLACQFRPCAVNFHKICPRTEHTQQERECKPEDKRHNTNSIHTYRCWCLALPAWICAMPAWRFPRNSATRTRTRTRKHLSGHTQAPSTYTCTCKDKCTP